MKERTVEIWDVLYSLIINYMFHETSYVPSYCCQKLLERTLFLLFFFFSFINEEPAIVFVLFVLATSVSIAREITFLPDNKLMSQEESCNWCSRRDEIDVDLSNKEYLAPRRKEKGGRENLSTFRRRGRGYTSAMRFISVVELIDFNYTPGFITLRWTWTTTTVTRKCNARAISSIGSIRPVF